MVDFLVLVRTVGDVDFIGREPDNWTVLVVWSFDFQIVSTVDVRLVEFGDSWEEWTRNLRQRVIAASMVARKCGINQLTYCDGL